MQHDPEASASPDRGEAESFDQHYVFDYTPVDELAAGQRWSTWGQCQPLSRGPQPWPDWVVTDDAAVDTELGVLKTGKEADVFIVERAAPFDDRTARMAAKRYRDSDHRTFHHNAAYLEGRRMPRKGGREARALAKGSSHGRAVAAGMWAWAEWERLVQLHRAGLPVPYPVQIDGTEILMELVCDPDGQPAPRLSATRPGPDLLDSLWQQLTDTLTGLAACGYAHGDLSAYNLLVAGERLVIIDLPQAVDLVANPRGMEFLHRDCRNVAGWFAARGHRGDAEELFAHAVAAAF
ncbi:serine protein kinase RIO [Rudaeicoccus suwonensis]|uniref:non-specific serine/threonine protein kinase n=1 Tax=Rudaeicoccus suwonensis TaxID=657409 RepID=A0A561ECG6_9MICO|nr:RIO1 family regulatory kinase/ATPase [Rudaeicoccus suwonensis]TWE13277.1 RIO kinase 1 [Rudaeicoccus suwonensis]